MIGEAAQQQLPLEITASRQLTAWLAEQHASIVFTTYQTGKIFFIGTQPDGRLSIFERTFHRAMGLWATREELYLSDLIQVWRFVNVLQPGQQHNGYDVLYLPRSSQVTGDLDIHDLAIDNEGRTIFANTLFSCVATIDEHYNFRPLWKPPFITRLAAEDRCHLNGLALRDGKPRYVTAVSQSDVADGWRDRRRDGGFAMDIESNQVLADNLSMPHSPRWHDGRLWLLDSGTGYLGYVDPGKRAFVPVTFCPGYARGLAFHGHFAVVGLSQCRENRTFGGLALDDNLKTKDAEPRCGLLVIDIRTGDIAHWLRIEGIVRELYDVAVVSGARRPMAIGFKTDEVRRFIAQP